MTNLQQVLPLFSEYKVIVLGDREFCSIDLGNWLKQKGVSFCLRLKALLSLWCKMYLIINLPL
jgi:hypothetical protein